MIGGRFEGANRPDFKDAVTLLIIDRQQVYPLERFPLKVANTAQVYRYIRYVAPADSRKGNVAEIEFYGLNGRQLPGRPIGSMGDVTKRGPAAVFDGNLESFFYTPDTTEIWVGLDLGDPKQITEIAFAARTDDNEIRIGDIYLYYWHDGWRLCRR